MTRIEKKFWRAFFFAATAVLLPFTLAAAVATAVLGGITFALLRWIGVVLFKSDQHR